MTQTSTATEDIARYAQVTLAYLDTEHMSGERPITTAYLALIEHAQTELEAIAAGMWNQGPEQLVLQNRCWSAQKAANLEIVQAALAAGVDADEIMVITHREA